MSDGAITANGRVDRRVGRPAPEETGVGEWCAPGPAGQQKRQWLLTFEDRDMGVSIFDSEDDARESFARHEAGGWNCHLFQHAPRFAPVEQEPQHVEDGDGPDRPQMECPTCLQPDCLGC